MATYEKCPKPVMDLMKAVLERHHPELTAAGVRVSALFAFAPRDRMGFPNGPAVKLHGYQCAATIKITSLKRRVLGSADAEMTIDGDQWPSWSDSRRRALLDHELQHLELIEEAPGIAKKDDANRPKLKARLHDWELGGFAIIVHRHGEFAFEHTGVSDLMDAHGQLLFPWLNFSAKPQSVQSGTPAAPPAGQDLSPKAVEEAAEPPPANPAEPPGPPPPLVVGPPVIIDFVNTFPSALPGMDVGGKLNTKPRVRDFHAELLARQQERMKDGFSAYESMEALFAGDPTHNPSADDTIEGLRKDMAGIQDEIDADYRSYEQTFGPAAAAAFRAFVVADFRSKRQPREDAA